MSLQLGSTLVGITELNPDWVYGYPIRGRGFENLDEPLEIPDWWTYAIVVGTPMSWDPMYRESQLRDLQRRLLPVPDHRRPGGGLHQGPGVSGPNPHSRDQLRPDGSPHLPSMPGWESRAGTGS